MALRLGDPMAVDVAYADEVLSSGDGSINLLLLKPLYFMVIIPYPIAIACVATSGGTPIIKLFVGTCRINRGASVFKLPASSYH